MNEHATLVIDDWGPRIQGISNPGAWAMPYLRTVIGLTFNNPERLQITSIRYNCGTSLVEFNT